MKKKISIVLCFILIVASFLAIKINSIEIKEFKSVVNSMVYMDPVPNYINKIEINLDERKMRISPAYTYRELKSVYESNWGFADGSRCSIGNNNIYFEVCPSSEKCNLDDTVSVDYSGQVMGNRYHWVNFEVYTKSCNQGSSFCENDFDPEHLNQIEVWLNGTKINDAVVSYYNDYWHSVDVFIPIPGYSNPIVREIIVKSDTDYVQKGTTSNFTTEIKSYGDGTNNVNWSVIGEESNGTSISSSGVLTVAADETADSVKVRATSTFDNTVYGEKTVHIIDEPLSINSVTIRDKENITVVYGGKYYFYASVSGTGNHDIIWSITGANKVGTSITEDGVLTVASDETAKNIIVTAKSAFDNTKKDSTTITTRETEYINKIEINYDTDMVVFSNKSTYNEVKSLLKNTWELPSNAGYDRGNNNIWIDVCPTSERCTNDFIGGYSEKMALDKYTYVNFEVFAKPSGKSYSENILYDFDKDHLNNIEIWVNGVKRNDAYISVYNDSWREVDVMVPITITNDKLNQYFEFNYDSWNAYYGDSSFVNSVRSYGKIGDGEITWSSSNTDVATVDNDGYVTVKKIGTCIITAHASETEDYNEYSNSYTLIVNPKSIYPSINGVESSYYYTGSQIKPDISVTYNDITLVKDVDYTISYDENLNTGYGRVYINPVDGSNYTFSERNASFYISRKSIQDSDISIDPVSVEYDGSAKYVNVTVTVDGRQLVKDVDYTVSYSSNTNVGTAYVYITGIGNYNGNSSVTFEITEAPEYEKGDMNKDGEIGLQDIIALLKCYLGIDDPTQEQVTIGDMNNDGEIGLQDVIMLLRVYLGID